MSLNSHSWPRFLSRCATGLGTLLLASGLITWVAANWWHWAAWLRLGLVQLLVLVCLLAACGLRSWQNRFHPDLAASSLLTGLASVAVGGLLALIGQIYQSGADPWQLFALWAVLILPMVLTVRTLFLSLLEFVLLNVAMFLYWQTLHTYALSTSLALCLLNTLLWCVFNTVYRARGDAWRVLARLAALGMLVAGVSMLGSQHTLILMGGFLLWFVVQRYWRYDGVVAILSLVGAHISAFYGVFTWLDFTLGLCLVLIVLGFWLVRWRTLVALFVVPTPHQPTSVASQSSTANHPPQPPASVSSDRHDSWYIRLFKLCFVLVLLAVMLAFLAVSLGLDEQELAWLGLALLLASPVLVYRTQVAGVTADLIAFLQVLGIALFSVMSIYGQVYPFAFWVACLFAMCWSLLLYCLPAQSFLIRCILVVWGVGAALALLAHYDFAVYAVWVSVSMWACCFLLALLVGHGIYRRGWNPALYSPLFWVFLLSGLYGQQTLVFNFVHAEQNLAWLELILTHVLPSLPVLVLLVYWPLRRSPSLSQWVVFGALVALCFIWRQYSLVTLALTCLLLGHAWRKRSLVVVGLLSMVYGLGNLYYYMPLSLTYKAYVLLATGLGMLVMAGLGGYVRIHAFTAQPGATESKVSVRTLGIVLSLLASLTVANALIYTKDGVLRSGKTVVLELAPVDPRSLLQGDYMALRFSVQQHVAEMLADMPPALAQAVQEANRVRVLMTPNEEGVFGLRAIQIPDQSKELYFARDARYQNKQNWPPEAVLVRLQRRGSDWTLGTDAWFFPEGRAQDFEQARYGLFKTNARGVSILTEMLDENLQPIERLLIREQEQ